MQMEQADGEVIAMPGLRSRMAVYQQTTKKKKGTHTSSKDKKKKVGKLQDNLRNPGNFESSTHNKQMKPVFQVSDNNDVIEEALQLHRDDEGYELGSEEEPEDTHLTLSPQRRSKPAVPTMNVHSPTKSPRAHGGMTGTVDLAAASSSPNKSNNPNNGGGGGHRYHPPTEVEIQARSKLNTLLQHEMKDNKPAHTYDVCRVRYLRAVGKLRPVDYYGEGDDSFQSEATPVPSGELIQKRREKRQTEKEKKGRYDRLTKSWYTYEDVATDKPVEMTPEDEEIEKDLDEIENEIHEEWEDFAEDVIRAAEEDAELGIDEDSDIDEWRGEARKLKEDADIRKKRKEERTKRRKEKLEEKRRLEALEAERKKKEEEARVEQEAKEKPAQEEPKPGQEAEGEIAVEQEAAVVIVDEEEEEQAVPEEDIAVAGPTAEKSPEPEATKKHARRHKKHASGTSGANETTGEVSLSGADADNEKEDHHNSPTAKGRGKRASKHKKKDHTDAEDDAGVHGDGEDDDEDEKDHQKLADPFACMGVQLMSETERPKTIKQDTSSHVQAAEESATDTSASHSVTDTDRSGCGNTETGDSLAMMTDAALSPHKGRRTVGKVPVDGEIMKKGAYFDDEDEEEEDILPEAKHDQKQGIEKQSGHDDPQLSADDGQKRKKKELRIEYDNGIPKEITIIFNNDQNKKKNKRKGKASAEIEDDITVSDVSESEFSSDESETETSLSLPTEKKSLPSPKKKEKENKLVTKKATKERAKNDVMRIDVLPNQQFYDGTEESPFLAWTHRPLKCKIDGSQINVKVPPRTDCWRKTRHNFIMDNAPFYWHRVNGDFEVMVKVSGDMQKMYDKAGIMIRLDAENWIVSGLEYFNNELNHMTCVTRDYTDWSMAPLPAEAKSHGAWICIKRIGNAYESFCSMDGRNWRQARQGLFTDARSVRVGIFCACPMGDNFKVTFDKYRCKNLGF